MNSIILCDVDGTLANITHRLHYIKTAPKNYDAFYAAVEHDAPIYPIIYLINALRWYDSEDTKVLFVSGRPDHTREATLNWLHRYVELYPAKCDYELWMRPSGDFRADWIIKKELLDQIRAAHVGDDILFVLDDRQQCVDMWRREGLACLQVAKGNF